MPFRCLEDRRKYQKAWAEKNRVKCRAASKRHYEKTKASGGRTWERANPDKVREFNRLSARRRYVPSARVLMGEEEKVLSNRRSAAKYRAKNKAAADASTRRWVLANPERVRANKRAWAKRNPDKIREKARIEMQNRRAAARRGHVTRADWEAIVSAYLGCCAYCGCRGRMTMDHIVPLCRGGLHEVQNLAPACRGCNARKGKRLLSEWNS